MRTTWTTRAIFQSLILLSAAAGASVAACGSSSSANGGPGPGAPEAGTPEAGTDSGHDPVTSTNPPAAVVDAGASDAPCVKAAVPGTSGVPGTTPIATLSAANRDLLCAWTAHVYGGYGCGIRCSSDLTLTLHESPALCDVNLKRPNCKASVADLERCLVKDAEDICGLIFMDAPECDAWAQCMRL